MLKRIFDFSCSLIGLVLVSPFFLVISILISLDSKGPIFYKQNRVGKAGIDFKLLKFRTMFINSDKHGLLTVGSRDGRITKMGFWLRKYKLDEIPQLVNVLMGQMSVVGPRPEVRKYVELYSGEQFKVLNVKPGITDWASIKFSNENELLSKAENPEKYYIETVMPEKLRLNLQYVNHNNLLNDVKIIFFTLMKIARH